MSPDLGLIWPPMVERLERGRADVERRLGWTWESYISTARTYASQRVEWDRYQQPPHWPTAANPDAVGFSIDLRGRAFTQHGSLHMLQPDLDGRAAAVDIQWPGSTPAWRAVSAMAAAPILAEHGLGFPIAGEYWHCQAFDWRGEYQDHHEPAAVPPEEDEMLKLVKVNGYAAVFIGSTTRFPSGMEGLQWVKWLRDGNVSAAYLAQGVETITVDRGDLKNVALMGPAPVGDPYGGWADSDFA